MSNKQYKLSNIYSLRIMDLIIWLRSSQSFKYATLTFKRLRSSILTTQAYTRYLRTIWPTTDYESLPFYLRLWIRIHKVKLFSSQILILSCPVKPGRVQKSNTRSAYIFRLTEIADSQANSSIHLLHTNSSILYTLQRRVGRFTNKEQTFSIFNPKLTNTPRGTAISDFLFFDTP